MDRKLSFRRRHCVVVQDHAVGVVAGMLGLIVNSASGVRFLYTVGANYFVLVRHLGVDGGRVHSRVEEALLGGWSKLDLNV